MAKNSGVIGGAWIVIALVVYVVTEYGKIILISLGTLFGLALVYFIIRHIFRSYKWREKLKILPKNGLPEKIMEKALMSKVFMSIKTDNREKLTKELINRVYSKAINITYFVNDSTVYDEKLNYLVHAIASELKRESKTKK